MKILSLRRDSVALEWNSGRSVIKLWRCLSVLGCISGVSNIRPAGHNLAHQAFLSGPRGLFVFYRALLVVNICCRNVKSDRFVSVRCVFSSSEICQNSFSVGALPQTPLGELTMLPQTPLHIPFPSTPLAPQLSGPDQFEICTLGPPVKKVEHSWINRAHVHAAIWNCSGHWTVHSSLQKK